VQQVQVVIVGAARPPQRPESRIPARAVGVRLAARRKRYGAARPAASRNLGGEQRIRYPQTRSPRGVIPVHSGTLPICRVEGGGPARVSPEKRGRRH
jgi:hypothetical protein